MGDPVQIKALATGAKEASGGIDIVVTNARRITGQLIVVDKELSAIIQDAFAPGGAPMDI